MFRAVVIDGFLFRIELATVYLVGDEARLESFSWPLVAAEARGP